MNVGKIRGPMRSALVISGFFAVLRFAGCPFVDLVDVRATDFRFVQRGPRDASPEVAIVAVDDRSIEEIGRWPWPRSTQAELLEVITAGEPSVVGFDIVQSEATAPIDRRAILQSLGELDRDEMSLFERVLASQGAPDHRFARAIEQSSGRFWDITWTSRTG